jgi:hypothetical protein
VVGRVEEEGLLEHVLPAHRRMQDLVAVDDPGRSRREVDARLRAALLEAGSALARSWSWSMTWSYSVRRRFVMPVLCISQALPASGRPIAPR